MFIKQNKIILFIQFIIAFLLICLHCIPCFAQEEMTSEEVSYIIEVKPIIKTKTQPEEITLEALNKNTGESSIFTLYRINNYEEFIYVNTIGEYTFFAAGNDPLNKTQYVVEEYNVTLDGRPLVVATPTVTECEKKVPVIVETTLETTIKENMESSTMTPVTKVEGSTQVDTADNSGMTEKNTEYSTDYQNTDNKINKENFKMPLIIISSVSLIFLFSILFIFIIKPKLNN